MNTAAYPTTTPTRSLRAQFSPVSPRVTTGARSNAARPIVASATLDFAERSFLNRWAQAGLLDRLQPALTRYRE